MENTTMADSFVQAHADVCWLCISLDKLCPVKLVWGAREGGEKEAGSKMIWKRGGLPFISQRSRPTITRRNTV